MGARVNVELSYPETENAFVSPLEQVDDSKQREFERARAEYVHRYTMEHKPAWADKTCS